MFINNQLSSTRKLFLALIFNRCFFLINNFLKLFIACENCITRKSHFFFSFQNIKHRLIILSVIQRISNFQYETYDFSVIICRFIWNLYSYFVTKLYISIYISQNHMFINFLFNAKNVSSAYIIKSFIFTVTVFLCDSYFIILCEYKSF